MNFKELRQQSGMNKAQFSKYFGIPYRTIQNWELGERHCPEYLLKLMQYKLEKESIIR
jgi:DNA-binding transcriptional regulator YiaG